MEPIQSTAGAVPVVNEKGEISMQKVKVHRYVSGKRPEYAPATSSEEESEDEDFLERRPGSPSMTDDIEKLPESMITEDPRLRRLITRQAEPDSENEDDDDEPRYRRRRRLHEPEVLEDSDDDNEEERRERMEMGSSNDDEDENLSDSEIEKRRQLLKQKLLMQKQAQLTEVLEKEDEGVHSADGSDDDSEYEECTDSEEETGPRLKPVFIRKRDRHTIMEKEKETARKKQAELESKKKLEERRRQTLKIVEEEIRKEQSVKKSIGDEGNIDDVNTDDENDEVEYETWKLRELKRIKRDREEREQIEKERQEIERFRNMTEEERRAELRLNPKVVTNKSVKGKYKFMQKYFHRGAFYLDKDDSLFKRNFATPTLDDHFEKTILPKVMQVKNFGRSGRTKYTHLVDQDTTVFDSPWVSETTQNLKFFSNQAAGVKQQFTKPSLKKYK